ncbi:CehA/McbA family metallohydrolase [Sinimarinibacterium thermocellulolyticum]|uniref:CehA/McbA family metallohydrolase n=1 Tax=Sinimarinibacterium thermocellulolyticum TaxID=3170016 RepID=A0ABV2A606_9GAMM
MQGPQRRKAGIVVAVIGGIALSACGDSTVPGDGVGEAGRVRIEGRGQMVSSPRTLDCFADCTMPLAAGDRLLAIAARDWRFERWDGACAGQATVECVLPAGGSIEVVARFVPAPQDLSGAQWRRGDLHQHSDHSSDGSLGRQLGDDQAPGNMPLADIIAQAEAAGLDFLPITDHRTHDQHYDPQWESSGLLLITGEEANGSPHATVHGAVDMIDQNARIDGEPESRVVQESIWLAHSQGAAWVTAHPDDGSVDEGGVPNARADAVGVDLVEIWNRASYVEGEIDYVENRWNAGFRFGIAGASDNHFKELWPLGGGTGRPTTEVLTPELSDRALIDALRAGRTGVHSGDALSPRLRIDADFDGDGVFEVRAGEEVFVPAGTPGKLRVRIEQGLGNRVLVYAAPGRSAGALAEVIATSVIGFEELVLDIVAGDTPSWYRAEMRSLGLADPSSLLFGTVLGPYDLDNLFQQLLAQVRALSGPIFVSTAPVTPQGQHLPPPDRGTDDGAEYALGAPGEFAGFVDAAHDAASGRLHLVAEVHDAVSTRVHYAARAADGRWRAPLELSASTSARFPRIAVAGDHVVVVWQDERAGQIPRRAAIHARISRDGGAHFGDEIVVRAVDGRAMHPDVALAADGRAHVVWQQIRAGEPFDVWYTILDADGRLADPINLSRDGKEIVAASGLDARSARYPASVRPAIAIGADDVPLIAWQDNRFDIDPLWTGQAGSGEGTDPDDWQIAVYSPGRAIEYLGAADAADRHVDVIVDGLGRAHAVWTSKPLAAAGANLRVLAAVRAAGAASFAAPQAVDEFAASSARAPRLGLAADGAARLAWFDSRSSDWRWRVMSARFEQGAWRDVRLYGGRGVNTWPVPAGAFLAFATTRHAERVQRDRTQQIYVLDVEPSE